MRPRGRGRLLGDLGWACLPRPRGAAGPPLFQAGPWRRRGPLRPWPASSDPPRPLSKSARARIGHGVRSSEARRWTWRALERPSVWVSRWAASNGAVIMSVARVAISVGSTAVSDCNACKAFCATSESFDFSAVGSVGHAPPSPPPPLPSRWRWRSAAKGMLHSHPGPTLSLPTVVAREAHTQPWGSQQATYAPARPPARAHLPRP